MNKTAIENEFFKLYSSELEDFINGGRAVRGLAEARALARELARAMSAPMRTIEIVAVAPPAYAYNA